MIAPRQSIVSSSAATVRRWLGAASLDRGGGAPWPFGHGCSERRSAPRTAPTPSPPGEYGGGVRFLLRPGWIALVIVVVGFAVAAFTLLAPWQFGREPDDRHDERYPPGPQEEPHDPTILA
jgi:hypothetical protein